MVSTYFGIPVGGSMLLLVGLNRAGIIPPPGMAGP